MSYSDQEHSLDSGDAVELYRWQVRSEPAICHTSGDVQQVHEGQVYTPETIDRGVRELGGRMQRQSIDITVRRDHSVAARFAAAAPDGQMRLTIFRRHRGGGQTIVYWTGRVTNVRWQGATAVLMCEPRYTTLGRALARTRFTDLCRHELFGPGCGVLADAYGLEGALMEASGNKIRASAWASKPDGYYNGGKVVVANVPRRFVLQHVGDTLTLNGPLVGAHVGTVATAFAGCPKTAEVCRDRFENLPRFGGFGYLPQRNPHDPEGIG